MRHARAVVHAGIANSRIPLKSVAGKSFSAFPTHAQPAILRICQQAHGQYHDTHGGRLVFNFSPDTGVDNLLVKIVRFFDMKYNVIYFEEINLMNLLTKL